ncbi:hypothetical protein D3C81_1534510 [compost metagenome]
MFAASRHRHHAGTAAQRTLGAEQDRATQPAITADQQHVAEPAFMGSGCARGKARQIAGREATGTGRCALKQLRIGMQVVEHQLTYDIRRITGEQPRFQADEGDRQIRSHRTAEDATGIGA